MQEKLNSIGGACRFFCTNVQRQNDVLLCVCSIQGLLQ